MQFPLTREASGIVSRTPRHLSRPDDREAIVRGIVDSIEGQRSIEAFARAAEVELVAVPSAGVPFFLYDRFACYVVDDEPRVSVVRAARALAMMIGDRMGCQLTAETDALAMLFLVELGF